MPIINIDDKHLGEAVTVKMKIAEFDKLNKNTVTFVSGAIENPIVNKQIVDVLEGTYPAFHNRDCKYIEKK